MGMLTVQDLIRDPAGFLNRVEAGEELLLTRESVPVAEIKPCGPKIAARPIGLAEGEFVVPDDFDAPLPHDILASIYGP